MINASASPEETKTEAATKGATASLDVAPPDNGKKSWGEKYKTKLYHLTRDWGLNYIVNFIAGASITYAFDTSKWGEKVRTGANNFADKHKAIVPAGLSKYLFKFLTRTQLLLCGGHLMVPILKGMKDNKNRIEFHMGHMLDKVQETFGFGNEASKRSLKEYHRVSQLVAIGDHNRTQPVPIDLPELNARDKALLDKHNVNSRLHFADQKQGWWRVIKARLFGVGVTTGMSVGLAVTSQKSMPSFLNFEDRIETPVGKILGSHIISRIPLVSRIFSKDPVMLDTVGPGETPLTGHQLIGKYFIDDMIFTAGSKFGFDKKEHQLDLKAAAAEEAREIAKTHSPALAERRRLAQQQPKSFASRKQEEEASSLYLVP